MPETGIYLSTYAHNDARNYTPGHTPLWFIRLAFHSICKSVYNTLVYEFTSRARTSFFQKLFRVNKFRFIDHLRNRRIIIYTHTKVYIETLCAYNSHTPTECFPFLLFLLPFADFRAFFNRHLYACSGINHERVYQRQPFTYLDRVCSTWRTLYNRGIHL